MDYFPMCADRKRITVAADRNVPTELVIDVGIRRLEIRLLNPFHAIESKYPRSA